VDSSIFAKEGNEFFRNIKNHTASDRATYPEEPSPKQHISNLSQYGCLLCILIVIYVLFCIYFSSCQLALFGYPHCGFSVLVSQLYGKCQGIIRKDEAQPALFLISEMCCSLVNFVFLLLIVLFYVLFVCKCVLYYCHWVSTQLQYTNISYHIISHHITSHHITSHHITSHHITSHHITSYYKSYNTIPHRNISYHTISYHVISYIISYHITSYHYCSLLFSHF
jgi:hypothetical protein